MGLNRFCQVLEVFYFFNDFLLFYDQLEWERHCRKRKARLECATEDAFSHVMRHEGHTSRKNIRRQLDKNGDRYPPNIMDANEAATVSILNFNQFFL